MDKISFFNMTLHLLGDREYFRDTPSGIECDLWFPQVYHDALSYGAWSFSSKLIDISKNKHSRFDLPEDCIRVLSVSLDRFSLVGREIVPNHPKTETITLRYISNDLAKQETLPEQEPKFTRALSLLLASRIAIKITSSQQLAILLEQQANEALRDALHHNVSQFASNDQHPLADLLNNALF